MTKLGKLVATAEQLLILLGVAFLIILMGGLLYLFHAASTGPHLLPGQVEKAAFIEAQFMRNPKTVDLSDLNDGDWISACAAGALTEKQRRIEALRSKGIDADEMALNGIPVIKNSGGVFFYVQRDRKVQWFQSPSLNTQLAPGEVLCVSKDSPIMRLPTQAALKSYWGRTP